MQSKVSVDLFKFLGANPTPLDFGEALYTALQTRLVDGESAPFVSIETSRFFEVNKYISMTNHAWSGPWHVANGDAWKSLPPDLQGIVERNNTKYAKLERRDAKLGDVAMAGKLARQGMIINRVDQAPFHAPLRPYYEEWAKEFGPTEWGLLESSLGRKLV